MLEVHNPISHFIEALTEKKTKALRKGMYARSGQQSRMRLTKWKSWSSLPRKLSMLDHPCLNLPVKLCSLGRVLTWETFPILKG
jgi:hypothetical protein